MYKRYGFTIVELLIAIVLIAILAAISIVAYSGIQERARDSKRSSEISAIQQALEMYKVTNGTYPAACGIENHDQDCSVDYLKPFLVPSYVNTIPTGDNQRDYNYVTNYQGTSYGLLVLYEMRPVCKAGKGGGGYWGSAVPWCDKI